MKILIFILLILSSDILFSQWKDIEVPKGRIQISDVLYANDVLVAYWNNDLYRSFDNGDSWEKLAPKGLDSNYDTRNIYTNDKLIYLVSNGYKKKVGIFKSIDYGENFELVSDLSIEDIIMQNDEFLLSGNGLFLTKDFKNIDTLLVEKNGYSFNKIELFNDKIIYYDKGVNSFNPPIRNNGIVYSNDKGQSWEEWNLGLSKNMALYNDILLTDSVSYLATSIGLYKSASVGEQWEIVKVPSSSKNITSIELSNNMLYFTTDENEIYYSEDYGLTWNLFAQRINQRINKMRVVNDRLFVIGFGLYEIVNNNLIEIKLFDIVNIFELDFSVDEKLMLQSMAGMYISNTDNKWEFVNDSIQTNFFRFRVNDNLIISHYSNSNILYFSYDFGKSWKDTIIIQNPESIFEVNIFGDLITVVTENKLVYSNDRGKTWINFNDLNPDFSIRFRKIYQVNENTFLASTFYNGILISNDKCNSWKKVSDVSETNLNNETTFLIGIYGDNIIAPRYDSENFSNEFYLSTDLGKTWKIQKFSNTKIYIEDFINYKNNIFMSTTNGFLFSTNFGIEWNKYNLNIEMDSLTIKTQFMFRDLDIFNGNLYLTLKNRLLYLNLSELGIEYTNVDNTEQRNYLFTYPPYPLPSKTEVKVKARWDSALPITTDDISVYNINGIEVKVSDIKMVKETNYSGIVTINGSNLEPGVYFVIISHGTESRVSKILIE